MSPSCSDELHVAGVSHARISMLRLIHVRCHPSIPHVSPEGMTCQQCCKPTRDGIWLGLSHLHGCRYGAFSGYLHYFGARNYCDAHFDVEGADLSLVLAMLWKEMHESLHVALSHVLPCCTLLILRTLHSQVLPFCSGSSAHLSVRLCATCLTLNGFRVAFFV